MDNGKIVSENKENSTYTEVDFIADLEKVSSAYLVTVIISAIIASAGVAIAVIVSVFKATLQSVVVNIRNTQFCFHSGNTHSFKFQIRHCAGGILG